MANAISFYVGGKGNRKLKPRNMSTHLVQSLLDADKNGGVAKLVEFDFEYLGKKHKMQEERQVRLTQGQQFALLDEAVRRGL